MTSMFVKVALAGAAALPLTWLRADDDKKSDDTKVEKRVEVRVLRLDGKDGDKPHVLVVPADGDDKTEKRVQVKVLRLDGKDGDKPVVVLSDGDDKAEKRVQVKVLRADGKDGDVRVLLDDPDDKAEKRARVKVLRLDSKDGEKGDVRVLLDDESDDKPAAKTSYLGVVIESVPEALAAHLADVLPKDTGLLVAQVADDSPAANAGLKKNDILVSYGDEKLHSGEQLTKLVRGDKAGHEVALGVVRAGKLEKVKVTIGEREIKGGVFGIPGKHRILVDPRGDRKEAFRILKDLEDKAAPGAKAGANVKSNFSSMRLESIDGDRFKAEIEYKNEKGDSLKRSFEGTREEIQKQIDLDKEMPDAIRNQLLRSFDFGKGGKGAFHFNLPRGAFAFDLDSEDFPAFNWSGSGDFEKIFEQLSNQIDPQLREQLKGAFRSIEEPRKKPVPRNDSL